jgi:putative phage-type endonuclease
MRTRSEAEWLEARRQGITASEIAIVMGLSPYSSPYALYHQKLGQLPGVEETDAMQLGKHMESFVADRFAERHPEFNLTGNGQMLFAHAERPWQMATPDRLVTEGSFSAWDAIAVLECKIDGGSDEWGEDGSDEIPVHYRCQVLWQMDVMGVSTGYVACLLWNRRKVRVYELTLDAAAKEDLLMMRGEARLFLRRIEQGDEPDVDWRPATTAALKHLHPSIEDRTVEVRRMPVIQYRAALKAYKAAEQRKKLAENRLRQLLGTGNRLVSAHTGEVIATRQVYDLAAKTIERKACTVDKLVPARARKEPSA